MDPNPYESPADPSDDGERADMLYLGLVCVAIVCVAACVIAVLIGVLELAAANLT